MIEYHQVLASIMKQMRKCSDISIEETFKQNIELNEYENCLVISKVNI